MARISTITISLPESLKAFVEQEVATQGYGNVSEYFRSLLREAQALDARRRLDARLLAGLEGDVGISDPAFWPQLRLEAQRLLAGQHAPSSPWPAELIHHSAVIEALCRAHEVRELSLVGAGARADALPVSEQLEFAVHLGELSGEARVLAYAKFSSALAGVLERPIDLIEIGSMGPTRLRRLLEQTRRVLYPQASRR
jgi:antitoxin ParD1/3/4